MPRSHAALSVLLCSTVGCASSYVPRPGPRVAMVLEGGTYSYVRDGKTYKGGLFGGDIDKVVQGDPQAEKYARAYKTGMATGFALTMVGLAGIVAGAFVLTADAQQSQGGSVPATGLVVMGSGLVVEIVGAILELNAAPQLFDAINAYNDGLTDATQPPPHPARP
jgi:hypothetical protein